MLFTKKSLSLVDAWQSAMSEHPEIVIDVPQELVGQESRRFIEHRHDQAVLSGVVYSRFNTSRVLVLPNFSESLRKGGQAVFNSRISDDAIRKPAIPDKWIISLVKSCVIRPYRRFRMKLLNLSE